MIHFSSMAYLTRQGWKNMVHNRLMTLACIGILTACLFITGMAVLLGLNVNNFANYLAGQNEVVVYLYDSVEQAQAAKQPQADAAVSDTPADSVSESTDTAETEAADSAAEGTTDAGTIVQTPIDIDAAVRIIESIDNVESYTYVTKEQALDEAIGWMGQYSSLLEDYRDDNPMPASFRITVKSLEQLDNTVAKLSAIDGVEYIKSPSEIASILVTVRKAVMWVAIGLVCVLGLVCVVVIGNTIRLTVFARRKEINIMKFVGATNAFIRWPFFVEGMTSGLIAALLSFGLLSAGYTELVKYVTTSGAGFTWLHNMLFSVLPYSTVSGPMLLVFAVAGVLLGGVGTASSIRKYLKV